MNFTNINKILLIIVAHMGDVVLTTPVARALKKQFSTAIIDILVSPFAKEATAHNPYINNVFVYAIDDWQKDKKKLLEIIQLLQIQNYQLALALNYGSLGPILAWFSGAPYRIGYADDKQNKFLTHIISSSAALKHESEKQLDVLTPLGITKQESHIEFVVFPEEMQSIKKKIKLSVDRPIIVFCPFSSHIHKNWTQNGWIELIQHFSPTAQCIFIGSKKERADIESINEKANYSALVCAGQLTLGESAALIKIASLFITVDTGPMHIAQAFDTPVIALMGPTHPLQWGPRNKKDIVIRSLNCSCSPCWYIYKNGYKASCLDHTCMNQITSVEIIKAAEYLLAH